MNLEALRTLDGRRLTVANDDVFAGLDIGFGPMTRYKVVGHSCLKVWVELRGWYKSCGDSGGNQARQPNIWTTKPGSPMVAHSKSSRNFYQ